MGRNAVHKHQMRGGGLALHRARRAAGERGQMTRADKVRLIEAFQRLGNEYAAAMEVKVHHLTGKKWIRIWQATGGFDSPGRGNSGRRRTATAPAVVRQVVAEMTAPAEGEYVPSSPDVRRKLKLPFSTRSVQRAAIRGGLESHPTQAQPFLTAAQQQRRKTWAGQIRRFLVTITDLRDAVRDSWKARTGCKECMGSL